MFKRLMESFDRMVGRGVIDEDFYEELEEALLQADIHIQTVQEILDELRRTVRDEKITEPAAMKERLKKSIADRFKQDRPAGLEINDTAPTLFLFVGVNGVGKTTTIAKVAHLLTKRGFKVVLAAGDTFRAAAIEQLEVWADRVGCQIVKSQPGSDASRLQDSLRRSRRNNPLKNATRTRQGHRRRNRVFACGIAMGAA